jgi:extracellular factor (EF) 3-hydroxypalmitic acid methyl ester biosynthesis protein
VSRIHDFEKLFFHGKVDTLEAASLNLSLVLGYKKSIDPAFRNYVSDLTYDLNVYGHQLDQIDAESRDESPAVREIILQSIIQRVGAELNTYLDGQCAELTRIVSGYSQNEHEHHGFYFRRQLWNTLLRAPIMARTNLKPRGYNGDSEMMRMIYLNEYQGDTTFGKILHKYSVGQAAAQAVRNRRGEVAELLHRYAVNHVMSSTEKLKILSVACGPAFEVREILRTRQDCERMHFSLFDQDQQALLEAASLVGEIESSLGTEISVDFIKESVRTMLVTRGLKDRWGQFHFIYSMGLFDYLTAPVAAAVLSKLYQLLTPGGELAIGNFSVGNPSRYYMEYWHDWRILYRSQEDFMQMAEGLPGAEVSVQYDQTGIQMLLHVRKQVADD